MFAGLIGFHGTQIASHALNRAVLVLGAVCKRGGRFMDTHANRRLRQGGDDATDTTFAARQWFTLGQARDGIAHACLALPVTARILSAKMENVAQHVRAALLC